MYLSAYLNLLTYEKELYQLTIYALALASRIKLAVKGFKCAWFDDKACYEFFPLHAVYLKQCNLNELNSF